MAMFLTDEQRMLAETLRLFLADHAPVSHLRALRDRSDPVAFDPALWRKFAEMGLNGVLIAEEFGGLGLGHVEAGIVLEEIGQNVTPSPFLLTAVGAAVAVRHASPKLQQSWLPRIAAGEAVAAIALEEAPRHRPERIALTAIKRGDHYVLNGAKRFVLQGHRADLIIVVARTSGGSGDDCGLTLFAIDGSTPGVAAETERLVDSSFAASLAFADVAVTTDRIIGQIDAGNAVLKPLLNALRTAAAAELVGVGTKAFAMTLAYLKERRQFDQPIGSFQALQHRAAHLHAELDLARAAVFKAQLLIDAGDAGAEGAAMVAKAMAGSASDLAVREGVQMHGGIGMTDEFDMGFYMKRQRVLSEMFGDSDYHSDRLARLQGY
jgi:alkylation response protein AidB-like acyl-CoA dehydrogenase